MFMTYRIAFMPARHLGIAIMVAGDDGVTAADAAHHVLSTCAFLLNKL
jgi:hypothetical protein